MAYVEFREVRAWAIGRVDPPPHLNYFNVYSLYFFIFYFFIFFLIFKLTTLFPGLLSRLAFFSDNDRFLASEEGKYGFTLCPGPRNDYKYGI
jgi:hypothetical protein